MPAPAHEQLHPPGKKAGRRPGNNPEAILSRIVDIGQMLVDQGMSLMEIYRWNITANPKDENHLARWNYSYRQIKNMCLQARKQGQSLLCKDHEEALLFTMRGYYALKRKAMAGGDFKVAFLCEREISKIRGTYLAENSAPLRKIAQPTADVPAMNWATSEDNSPVVEGEYVPDFDGAGIA